MSRNKNNYNKRRGSQAKLDEFPDDFDDTFFHNELVENNRKIPVLRNIVYRKVKDSVTERVESYGDNMIPLTDKFTVDFLTEGYSDFEWAVVREEMMSQGIEVTSEFREDKLFSISVHISREISLTMTMREMEIRDGGESESESESDTESDNGTEADSLVTECQEANSCKPDDGCEANDCKC